MHLGSHGHGPIKIAHVVLCLMKEFVDIFKTLEVIDSWTFLDTVLFGDKSVPSVNIFARFK